MSFCITVYFTCRLSLIGSRIILCFQSLEWNCILLLCLLCHDTSATPPSSFPPSLPPPSSLPPSLLPHCHYSCSLPLPWRNSTASRSAFPPSLRCPWKAPMKVRDTLWPQFVVWNWWPSHTDLSPLCFSCKCRWASANTGLPGDCLWHSQLVRLLVHWCVAVR